MEKEIEHIEERIENIEEYLPTDPVKHFAGVAFISFETEQQKQDVLESHSHTAFEKFKEFLGIAKYSFET